MKTLKISSSEQLNKRKDLFAVKEHAKTNDMLETGMAVFKLQVKYDLKPKEIRLELKKIGCIISLPHVYNYIRLANVPDKVKSYIKSGKINPTDVLAVIHKHQSKAELNKIVDSMVAEKEKELNAHKKKQHVEKVKSIEQKIFGFLERQGIMPTEKDRENLMRITGKYAL